MTRELIHTLPGVALPTRRNPNACRPGVSCSTLISILLGVALLNSCAGLHGYESVAALREDALAVFRVHNQTASDVMLLMPELNPDDPVTTALADADARMLIACEPLNDLAIAQREGQKPSLRQRSRLPATIDACRQTTRETRLILGTL